MWHLKGKGTMGGPKLACCASTLLHGGEKKMGGPCQFFKNVTI
jgi:hypothetical protein